ncbi:hypothetical protein L2E82_52268 [Cichorium intybus]|nr:hypothetical protein L2E82_52268 [Cichorium intybus]
MDLHRRFATIRCTQFLPTVFCCRLILLHRLNRLDKLRKEVQKRESFVNYKIGLFQENGYGDVPDKSESWAIMWGGLRLDEIKDSPGNTDAQEGDDDSDMLLSKEVTNDGNREKADGEIREDEDGFFYKELELQKRQILD